MQYLTNNILLLGNAEREKEKGTERERERQRETEIKKERGINVERVYSLYVCSKLHAAAHRYLLLGNAERERQRERERE